MTAPEGRLVVATRNAHKLREFERLLPGMDLEPLPAGIELPDETGDTFVANALIKARAAAAATGRSAIGDDSGIESAALGGRPGVRSARFAGEDADDAANLAKLRELAPVGSPLRYVCALAYVSASGEEEVHLGECHGTLAAEPSGDHGFGYDPVFLPAAADGSGRTMAELTDVEKDAISHRGNAARRLLDSLSAG
ncbi:MAG: Nucleoside 5-triphosphatase RdgB (dHAPTP, dITP, XTP-specific) [uncultured Solirubrobacteraceae bacterium]|uniref:dITP/XTP pyrophosphatase n=1 Tax=uncultured Solirubrobacteraceae bacterium TaxID=1162706 RepID=A0A6J4SGP8_9ACTN|nr:MAG: Nucleoside 5-triphosphatase RdgB (dHAPTP, dITP, XTP-specific) [uncultured Solirubrobacteraceae bacterium]